MKEAAVGPPGVMPIQQPTSELRSNATQWRGMPASVRQTSRHSTFDDTAFAWNSSSQAMSSSPTPKRPITATTKLMPLTKASMPSVRRTLPETVSMPMAAMAKPMHSDTSVFMGGAPPTPMKLEKARKYTAKY